MKTSLKEAAAIAKGQIAPSRSFVVSAPDVKSIREQTGLSQREFAFTPKVSIKIMQN